MDRVVIHHLTSTEYITYISLYLRWEGQTPEKIWILSDQTGMPAIINFRERKLVKMLLEVRDQENLNTYTYTYAEQSGKISFFCNSVGFGIPYATQYTNPQKYVFNSSEAVLPQADPNGLFMPSSAEATWVMCKSPKGEVKPVYVEPKVIVSPFKLP